MYGYLWIILLMGQHAQLNPCLHIFRGEAKANPCHVLIDGNVIENSWINEQVGAGQPHPEAAKPEPMVVKAHKRKVLVLCPWPVTEQCRKEAEDQEYFCTDPERVLLSTESGRKICVKFEEGK